jgi:hypothetical protein
MWSEFQQFLDDVARSWPSENVGLADQQEQRLCGIIESKEATPDEKFQALVDLAHLAGIVLHTAAEGEAEISLDLQHM